MRSSSNCAQCQDKGALCLTWAQDCFAQCSCSIHELYNSSFTFTLLSVLLLKSHIFEQVSTTSSATSRKHGCHSVHYTATSIPPQRVFHGAFSRLHTIQTTRQSCAKTFASSVLAAVHTAQSIELASLWTCDRRTKCSSTSRESSSHQHR